MTTNSRSPMRKALYRALHDPLTGLANRALLMDRLEQAPARAECRPGSVALLLLDLDGVKLVDDPLATPVAMLCSPK